MSVTQPPHIYMGSYTNNTKQPGLYDLVTQQMTALKINIPVLNPSYVLVHNGLIYFVEENKVGRLNVMDAQYNVLKTAMTFGEDPCHIAINGRGDRVVVTNYSSGSFIMYDVGNQKNWKVAGFVMHEGSSINPERQSSPHPHCSLFDYSDQILFVSDLGTDIVYYYKISYQGDGSIQVVKQNCLKMTGCGPRHLARGQPTQKLLYLTGQLDSSIRVLSYQKNKLQLLSAYRVSNNPKNYPSQVLYRNQTVYMANRGDNTLIIFDVPSIGVLKEKFRFKVGDWPRHFNISKKGTIYIACQFENIVQRFKFEDGKIYQLGSLNISAPSCINFEE